MPNKVDGAPASGVARTPAVPRRNPSNEHVNPAGVSASPTRHAAATLLVPLPAVIDVKSSRNQPRCRIPVATASFYPRIRPSAGTPIPANDKNRGFRA